MAVNSTSRTAMAPMTSLARRDSVGTGTGGRMATSGLLQFAGLSVRRSGSRQRPPVIPAQRTGTDGVPRGSAGGGCAPRLVVGEGVQRVVQRGHPGQREPGVGRLDRLVAVV